MKKKLGFIALLAFILVSCMQPYKGLKRMNFQELSYPYPVKYVNLDSGIRLAHTDIGTGPAIVMIHGLGSYLPAWQKNIETLRQRARCIAVDLPGYGKSSKGDYPFSMEFYADVIHEMLQKLGIKEAVIAGHSMGGQIAMVMALKYPEAVKGLVLVDPAGFEAFSAGEKQWFREVMTVDLVKNTPVQQIRANVVANFYNMPSDAEFMITDRIALREDPDFEWYCYAVSRSVAGMVDQPVIDRLNDIRQPTLILFGENDNLIPNPYLHGGKTADIAEIGHKKIPNSRLVIIPECGHFAQFEKPEIVNEAISKFLAEIQ
ncbi:MAG: alpha/beta hydrolase [Calditrichia bacterium]